MDPSKSTNIQDSSAAASAQQPKSSSNSDFSTRNMDHINSTSMRNVNIPASLYLANEISPESVMSELNMFSKWLATG